LLKMCMSCSNRVKPHDLAKKMLVQMWHLLILYTHTEHKGKTRSKHFDVLYSMM
jgi:hypothetical protein